jgi:hypothetical protein
MSSNGIEKNHGFVPPPSTRHELGVMFGFIGKIFLSSLSFFPLSFLFLPLPYSSTFLPVSNILSPPSSLFLLSPFSFLLTFLS